MADLSQLSLNQATVEQWGVRDAVEGCARAGIGWISLWRHKVAAQGLAESARIVRDAGVRVSSLCRGGMFPAASAAERQARIDDNRRAIAEAAELGTDTLVLVCGPAATKDLAAARAQIAEGIAAIVPEARAAGVRLGIEPLHPMFAAERSVITSLREANALAETLNTPEVGVVVDVYHVWWDADLSTQIKRASGRIWGFHVNDWLVPTPDMLYGRGMMGDGVIDIPPIRAQVEAAGYHGPIEVEIFNRDLMAISGDAVLDLVCQRFRSAV